MSKETKQVLWIALVAAVLFAILMPPMMRMDKDRAEATAAKLGGCVEYSVLHRGYEVVPCPATP